MAIRRTSGCSCSPSTTPGCGRARSKPATTGRCAAGGCPASDGWTTAVSAAQGRADEAAEHDHGVREGRPGSRPPDLPDPPDLLDLSDPSEIAGLSTVAPDREEACLRQAYGLRGPNPHVSA